MMTQMLHVEAPLFSAFSSYRVDARIFRFALRALADPDGLMAIQAHEM